jgi:hypothetical protein
VPRLMRRSLALVTYGLIICDKCPPSGETSAAWLSSRSAGSLLLDMTVGICSTPGHLLTPNPRLLGSVMALTLRKAPG